MDALEILKEDHEAVTRLFDQFRSADSWEECRRLFARIRSDLDVHFHIEETVFYPTFKKFSETEELVTHSISEHQEAKDLLAGIDAGALKDVKSFKAAMEPLMGAIQHHVREEEGEFFPKVRELMKLQEREVLGRHLQAAKNEKRAA